MSLPLAVLKQYLLALMGGRPLPYDEPALDDADWGELDAMAAQHRLQPLLAYHRERTVPASQVPAALAGTWSAARQRAGITSLTQQAALRLAAESLAAADLRFCVLKGPRLAWTCYPEPGLRPMRDLDLLVDEDRVLDAAAVLAEAGFAMDAGQAALGEALAGDKHLPPLWHRKLGVAVELHHRISDPPASRGYRVPQLDPAAMLDGSEPIMLAGAVVPCPSPTDLLSHLIVHALYGHRLDCGPLVLSDIHYLLAAATVDAPRFWQDAEVGRWTKGAGLLLALTEESFGPLPMEVPSSGVPPEAIMTAARQAMLQDFASRDHAVAMVDVLGARSPGALAGSLGRRLRPARHVVESEGQGLPGWRFWPVWAVRRVGRLVTHLGDRRAGGEARDAAALVRWLES